MPKYYHRYNKKTLQTISKANYLKDHSLPNLIPSEKLQSFQLLRSYNGNKNQKIYAIQQQNFQFQANVTPALLLSVFQKVYPTSNCTKLDSHSFINTYQMQKSSILNKTLQFQQLVDIVIVQKTPGQELQSQFSRRTYTKITSNNLLQKSQPESNDYEVYAVHFMYSANQNSPVKWDTFVQKYLFQNTSDRQGQPLTKITYSMVFSFIESVIKSYNFLNFVSSNNSSLEFLLKQFDPKKGNEEKLKKLQSYIFHFSETKDYQYNQTSQQSSLPCYSLELKRQRKVPPEHFMQYKKLKEKILKSYKILNKQFIQNGQIQDVDMKVENMVCRFLIDHDYDFQKASKQLSNYLTFDNDLRQNFTMSSFKHWIDMDIIDRIGFDRIGRPVILFKTYNFFASKCNDVNDYVNFLFYFIIVDSMQHCKGYIDEILLLADCSNNTMKNMKVEVNMRMVPTGIRYCPRMFFKLIPFKCNAIPFYAYSLAKPFLPSYSSQAILMVRQGDERVAFQQCIKWMDIDVIPQVIGGKNTTCRDITQKNPSTRDD